VQATRNQAEAGPPTILVAEDNVFLREMIAAILGIHGYRVITAADGMEALALLQQGGIDALVTDIVMPGGSDGWALAQQARAIDPDIAVVYSSSGLADPTRQVAGSLYLRKPYPPDAVAAAIRQLAPWSGDGQVRHEALPLKD
jgi:CheY-like chemotaxis protein